MRADMSLTDTKARNAKPKNKQFKLFDTDGLFLLVSPAGGKWWRFKYRFGGKEKLISLGTYPEVSLSQARGRRDAARNQVADGIDPSQVRKALKATKVQDENTFEVVAREWHTKFTPTWTPGHAVTILSRLELNVFPWIGARPIIEIKATELLMALRRIESRWRSKQRIGSEPYADRFFDMPLLQAEPKGIRRQTYGEPSPRLSRNTIQR